MARRLVIEMEMQTHEECIAGGGNARMDRRDFDYSQMRSVIAQLEYIIKLKAHSMSMKSPKDGPRIHDTLVNWKEE